MDNSFKKYDKRKNPHTNYFSNQKDNKENTIYLLSYEPNNFMVFLGFIKHFCILGSLYILNNQDTLLFCNSHSRKYPQA